MKPKKTLVPLIITILFALACVAINFPQTLPAPTPTQIWTITSSPTQTRTPTPLPPTATAVSLPTWIADFANPILVALVNRQPNFQDDFSQVNRGWFYFIPGNHRGPFYADIHNEALFLKLPKGTEDKESRVYNSELIHRNFVLSFDFKFGKTEPDDTARFQFNQTADQSVALDLSKNKNWTIHWSFHNNWQSSTGTYDYFTPERINVLIIMRGNECAMYLNRDPLAYLSNCRSGSIVQLSPLAVSFYMFGFPGDSAIASVDNVKLWDLDKVPGPP